MPAYNRVAYIGRTLDSVLTQSYPNLELIVVDDGSTDGTFDVLQAYAAKGLIRLLTHPGHVNRGQSAALNLGLDNMRGQFICILDSDDMFMPDKLRTQVEFLRTHPDIGLVYANGYAVDENDKRLYAIHPDDHREGNDPNRLLLDCYFLLPQNAMVRRDVFERAGRFEESFRSAQDHDMLLRIMEITQAAYLPDFLFCYRRHADSISSKGLHVRWRTGFEILRRAALRYPYEPATLRKRKALLHFRMAQVHWQTGRLAHALGSLVLAGFLDPLRSLAVLTGRERTRG